MQFPERMERILFIEFLLCSATTFVGAMIIGAPWVRVGTAGGRHFYKARRENNQPPSLRMAFGDSCKVWNIPHPVNIPLHRRRGKSIKCCERTTDLHSDPTEMFPTQLLVPLPQRRHRGQKHAWAEENPFATESIHRCDRCIDNNVTITAASDLTAGAASATSPISL